MKEYLHILRFLLFTFSLCLCWFILYDFWLSSLEDQLTIKVVNASVALLSALGYNAKASDYMIQIDGADMVFVYHACNGMILMALFSGFVIAFPGQWKLKLLYIPFGILVINTVNVLRVTALAINAQYYSHTVEFNHKYTFTIIVYAVIFALWMLWVKRFSGLNKYVSKQTSKA